MDAEPIKLESRVRLAATLVAGGLLLQLLSLVPLHPLAFIVFVGAAAPLMIAGVILFLLSIVY